MSKKESIDHLENGAQLCFQNADRLLQDAEYLFYDKRYPSSFYFSEIAIEEIAKGEALWKVVSSDKAFSREEWERLTKRRAHIRKMIIAQEADDQWLAEVSKQLGLDYEEIEKGRLSEAPWAKDMNDYREKKSEQSFRRRMNMLYIDYDFGKNEWISPLKIDSSFALHSSFFRLNLAKHLLQILGAKLRGKKEGAKP